MKNIINNSYILFKSVIFIQFKLQKLNILLIKDLFYIVINVLALNYYNKTSSIKMIYLFNGLFGDKIT